MQFCPQLASGPRSRPARAAELVGACEHVSSTLTLLMVTEHCGLFTSEKVLFLEFTYKSTKANNEVTNIDAILTHFSSL